MARPRYADVCPPAPAGRQAILRRVFEQNAGIAGPPGRLRSSHPGGSPPTPVVSRSRRRGLPRLACAALALWLALPDAADGPTRDEIASRTRPATLVADGSSAVETPTDTTEPFRPVPTAPMAPAATTTLELGLAAPADGTAAAAGLLAAGERRGLATLFGLRVQTVVLDPGHGGVDPGATGAKRLREKDLTLDVALRLAILLRQDHGFRVVLTREGDETVPLSKRVAIANTAGADLFVSIHANRLADARANAVETYYFGAPADEDAERLAEDENAGSGMAIGSFRELVTKLGDTLKSQESFALARQVQAGLLDGVMHRTGPPDAGVKVAPFVVLLGVEVPSVLAEVTCISSTREAVRLADGAYREEIAAALARGIAAYAAARNANGYPDGDSDHGQTISEGDYVGQGSG